MNIQASYNVLGINEVNDLAAIKTAHRSMIKRFHPDRFASDNEARQKAEEQSKLINAAFEVLKSHLARSSSTTGWGDFTGGKENFSNKKSEQHWAGDWSTGTREARSTRYRYGYRPFEKSSAPSHWCKADKMIRAFHSAFFVGSIGLTISTLGIF